METVKYLKVTLDNKISWKPHIENKTVACKKLMVMPNSNLRAKTKIIKMGVHWSMTWGNSINTVQQMKKLKALDRLAVCSTTTITRTTKQTSVELMIDLIPIDLMIQKVGLSAYLRLKTQLNISCAAMNVKYVHTAHVILGEINKKCTI